MIVEFGNDESHEPFFVNDEDTRISVIKAIEGAEKLSGKRVLAIEMNAFKLGDFLKFASDEIDIANPNRYFGHLCFLGVVLYVSENAFLSQLRVFLDSTGAKMPHVFWKACCRCCKENNVNSSRSLYDSGAIYCFKANRILCRNDKPPKNCLFALEHVVATQKDGICQKKE